jgi:hypothetical protein
MLRVLSEAATIFPTTILGKNESNCEGCRFLHH